MGCGGEGGPEGVKPGQVRCTEGGDGEQMGPGSERGNGHPGERDGHGGAEQS